MRLLARATVHVGDLRPGDEVWVDDEVPFVRQALGAEFLVALGHLDDPGHPGEAGPPGERLADARP